MQNNIDYREIVQTVTQNVMTEIVNKLNAMKPGIEQEIADAVLSSIDSRLSKLESSLSSLQSSLTELKQAPSNPAARATPVAARRTISGAASSSSAPPAMDTQTRVLLLKIEHWPRVTHKDWIIYSNKEDGHTYMMRKNGTDQIDISSFFNGKPTSFSSRVVENGSDWIIEYLNDSYKGEIAVLPMS